MNTNNQTELNSAQRQATHSPLPWHVCTLGEVPFHTSNIVTNDGHLVCNVQSFPHRTTGKADAELIVRACNNVEVLAEALKECRMALTLDYTGVTKAKKALCDLSAAASQAHNKAVLALAQWEKIAR
jgi:hypothetical protein